MDTPPRYYQFDSFRVDVAERQLWRGEQRVPLTPKVFDILLVLLENRGETVTKERLIREVWADTFVEEGSLNRNVSTLRKALGDAAGEQKFIKTLPKQGYRFTANVEEFLEPETRQDAKSELSPAGDTASRRSRRRFRIASGLLGLAAAAFAIFWFFNERRPALDLTGLSANERRQFARRGSKDRRAAEDYVRGRALWHERSAEALHESILLLERAVRADGEFALAHAALADAYAFDANRWKDARKHAETAIRLDPSLGEPFAARGFVQMFWEWDLAGADGSFRKAIELSPEYATAHQWFALNLVVRGLGGAALAEMKRAAELEPDSTAVSADLCQMFYLLRKYDEALAQCRRTLETEPGFLNAHLYLYEIYTARAMYDEAVAEFFEIERLKSDFTMPFDETETLRRAYARGGVRAFWQAQLTILERRPNHYRAAQYHARLGDKEKAVSRLRKSYESREFEFVLFLADPVFKDLHPEPAFAELGRAFDPARP
ncbi:MAG: winged helix-turn-helix domain-containing protein [Acidobacteria bacterium]|nr:winged helix-turn-helix domain-containing protein [Acidobacteriota bacterium]